MSKYVKPGVHERVHEFFGFLDIVAAFFELRQTHQAEAQLREIALRNRVFDILPLEHDSPFRINASH